MKRTIFILALILLTIGLGCTSNSKKEGYEMALEEELIPMTEQLVERSAPEVVERKLIKTGRVEFETNSLIETRKEVFEAIKKYKGYVSSDEEFKSPGRKSNTIVLRVPADDFDNFLNEATKGVERFDSREITVNDVTEEYLDVQARLKTKKELEQRFIELLDEAKNVTEVLEIEKQIGELRSDIESFEGRLKYLQDRISLSTLTMTFYESIPNETEFGQKFKNGFRNGWDNLVWFFVLLTNIWPFILIGIGLVVGIRFYRRKK